MLYLGADYAGYKLKEEIKKYLDKKKIKYHDFGTFSDKEKNDFPDFAYPVAKKVSKSKKDLGILVCVTGFGMCIAANRFKNIRAVLVASVKQAKWAKTHDNANILCFSSWLTNSHQAKKIIHKWLKTPFLRLVRRVRRFKKIEQWQK
jgi:RpiB/LacA/LacB family sugar-phosphate isomerase